MVLAHLFAWLLLPALVVGLGLDEHGQVGAVGQLPADVAAVAAGGQHAAALTSGGIVWTWGANRDGQLGSGSADAAERTVPASLAAPGHIVGVAAGYFHTLALDESGRVWSWGDDSYGQLGYAAGRCAGVVLCSAEPRAVDGVGGVVQVAAGFNHSLALARDGRVWAWGNGREGQLGDGERDEGPAPREVPLPVPARAVAAGGSQSLALGADGSVWAWGAVDAHRTFVLQPRRVEGVPAAAAIAVGEHHALALTVDGAVWAWGDDQYGQLGRPPGAESPAPVPGRPAIAAIAAGNNHNAALAADGSVWVWGGDDDGPWDVALHPERRAPMRLEGVPKARAVGIGPQQLYLIVGE